MQIRELNLKELDIAWEIVRQLREQLDYDAFEDLVYEMRESYVMIGLFEQKNLISYAGVEIATNLYNKRHLFVHELVTDSAQRSQGYGTMMLEYLRDYAKMAACENIVLSSGLSRKDAHRFYLREGFENRSLVFVKAL